MKDFELLNYMSRNNPYPEVVFPTTTEQAGALLRERGLSDTEITAISGCLCRHGYWVALENIKHYYGD